MRRSHRVTLLGSLAGILALAAACGSADTPEAGPGVAPTASPAPSAAAPSTAPAVTPAPPPAPPIDISKLSSLPISFSEIVARVRPAVVTISVRAQATRPVTGRPVNIIQSGTGVFIDPSGFVLTNQHVIDSGSRIEVMTDDDKTYVAELVGQDINSDLAVLKIVDQKPFLALPFADPSSYHVGDWVIAIGNALGLPGGPTVTIGVINALDRSIEVEHSVMSDLVQTDAVINEGNSGGPLLNLRGEIVGINSITAGQAASIGFGFAISSFTAAPVAKVLIQNGRITWAWLGLGIDDLSPAAALRYDLTVRQGVIVNGIARNGPAHVAGILPGDVLVRIDDTAIRRVRDVDLLLRDKYRAGQKASVMLTRNGEERTVQVTFTEPPRR
ncbi:MAG: PDZ domain-containing protein [Dehalococcoidia bacterium]|nr:PDZ domain-containing protein [Dehalococcoidia bacterium]